MYDMDSITLSKAEVRQIMIELSSYFATLRIIMEIEGPKEEGVILMEENLAARKMMLDKIVAAGWAS